MIDKEALQSIEELHRLKTAGVITEEEFTKSKERLLSGNNRARVGAPALGLPAGPVTLPADDDHFGWITLALRRFMDFGGRATRKEFWMFQIIPFAIGALTSV